MAEQAIPEAQQVEKVYSPDNPYYMEKELIREKYIRVQSIIYV